ncbi:hypothetical protein LTR95_007145 [Oleoguttula sp. CCFEE 5521]
MAEVQALSPGRCLLLELPPEMRPHIHSYLDEITTFTLKKVVLQDKQRVFRLKDNTPTPAVQLICRTIRDETWSLLYPATRVSLTICDQGFRAIKSKYERDRHEAYKKLEKLANSTSISSARELVVRLQSTSTSGEVMGAELVRALIEVRGCIEAAGNLQQVKIVIPLCCRHTVVGRLCRAVVAM